MQVALQMTLYKHSLEKKVKESEIRYREVVDTSQNAIISVDEAGKIVLWNSGAEKIFGYSKQEINSKFIQN